MLKLYKYVHNKIIGANNTKVIMECTDPLNGTIISDCVIPPDVMTYIMEFLDEKSILVCRLVCKNWEELVLLTLQTLYRHRFHLPTDELSLQYLHVRLYSNLIDVNLLKNVNGEEDFKHWDVLENGGDQFAVEHVPAGSDSLPDNIIEFNGRTSCFVTSYQTCRKRQVINVKYNSLLCRLLQEKPKIYASEWIAARFDCKASYRMSVTLFRGDVPVVKRYVERKLEAGDVQWEKVELEIDEYPEYITSIEFDHSGRDRQFWAGHYGIKMAGAVLKIVPTK